MALTVCKNPNMELVKKVSQSLEPIFSKFKISGKILFSELNRTVTFDLSPRGGRIEIKEIEEFEDVEGIW